MIKEIIEKSKKTFWNCVFICVGVLLISGILIQGYTISAEELKIKQTSNENFDFIAYSVVCDIGDAPINTAEHFIKCCSPEYKFDTIKGDLRVTSDNGIVMCHDPGFTLNSSGRIIGFNESNMVKIHDLTYEQCINLQYADKYQGKYVNVCDFETYLKICSENNKRAFITIRDEYIAELLDEILPIIYKYDMADKCIINSFTLKSLEMVKERDSSIELSWVVHKLTYDNIDIAIELNNCLITLFNFNEETRGGIKAFSDSIEYLAYAQNHDVKIYTAVVDNAMYIEDFYTFGISGGQFLVNSVHVYHAWDEPNYTWSEDKSYVKAERSCFCPKKHVESETVKTNREIIVDCTCTDYGLECFSADFSFPVFKNQEQEIITEPKGHIWGNVKYDWSNDYSYITATRQCLNNENHMETEKVGVNIRIIRKPTQKKDGIALYVSDDFNNPAFTKQMERENIPKLLPTSYCVANGKFIFNENREAILVSIIDDSLPEFVVPNSIKVNGETIIVTEIGEGAFLNNKALDSVKIGSNIEIINKDAFKGCINLTTFKGGESIKKIKDCAFSGCKSLTAFILYPNVEYLGKKVFYGCKKIKTLEIYSDRLNIKNTKTKAFKGIGGNVTIMCKKELFDDYSALLKKRGVSGELSYKEIV